MAASGEYRLYCPKIDPQNGLREPRSELSLAQAMRHSVPEHQDPRRGETGQRAQSRRTVT
jgi:hypothetical protein